MTERDTQHDAQNLVYIMRKQLTPDKIEEVYQKLSLIFRFADLSVSDLAHAAELNWKDFEDAVQSVTAERVHADYIITRNVRDFAQSKKKRVSQFELSLATGIDRSTVSRLEAGNRTIRLDTLGLIHQALSVPVTLLLPADWIEGTIEAECMKLTEEQQSVVKMALEGMINALKT